MVHEMADDSGDQARSDDHVDRYGSEILDEHICLALLQESDVGRLAVVVAEQPEIFPVNFIVDHGEVLFRTADGTKLAAVALGAAVAFEADGCDRRSGEAWSVVVKGRAEEVHDVYELFEAAGLPLYPWQSAPKPLFVRITPSEITGRRFQVVDAVPLAPPRRASHE